MLKRVPRVFLFFWLCRCGCLDSVLAQIKSTKEPSTKPYHTADMGEGEEETNDSAVEILERGDIFFFYRPKVGKEEAQGAEDVQRFYLLLRPDQGMLRLIVMGRKALPDPSQKSTPFWGFVDLVTTDVHHIKDALQGREYDTATRGHRHLPNCRAAGEGVYRILNHNHNHSHTHLIYKLEYPEEGVEGKPQEALNIARQASFLIQIKNPDQHTSSSSSSTTKKKKKASFPAHLQGLFGHNRYHPADPPQFLNHEGCEFLLISASDDVQQELGLELKTEHAQCPDLIQTFGDDPAGEVSLRPLFHGTWD